LRSVCVRACVQGCETPMRLDVPALVERSVRLLRVAGMLLLRRYTTANGRAEYCPSCGTSPRTSGSRCASRSASGPSSWAPACSTATDRCGPRRVREHLGRAAAWSLCAHPPAPQIIPAVLELLQDPIPKVRARAGPRLRRRSPALPALLSRVEDHASPRCLPSGSRSRAVRTRVVHGVDAVRDNRQVPGDAHPGTRKVCSLPGH
jgi:hypothetical protein